MSNDIPPRARLADFGCTITVLNPDQRLYGARVAGGTLRFDSPERMIPQKYGKDDSMPTPQSDIYAFGLVIFQVCQQDCGYRPFLLILSPGPYW